MRAELIDLRSDTVTKPTEEMRDAMHKARIGAFTDQDDPTVAELESLGAKEFGKEASLFLPSVTMANLIACMCYGRPGDQVVVDVDAHVYRNEVSSMTRVAGLMPRVVPRMGALPDIDAVSRALSYRSGGATPISLLWIENTHNVAGGAIADQEGLAAIRAITHDRGIPVHVDGARIFDAVVALGVSPVELAAEVDSLSVGFTKGLACPIGSLLVGSRALIDAALPLRRMLGGRLLKAGVVAAACIVAIRSMVNRLAEDHAAARRLGTAIEAIPGLRLDTPVVTNIVRFDTSEICPAQQFVDVLAAEGVLVGAVGYSVIRAVTHRHFTPEKVERAIDILSIAARKAANSRKVAID